MWGLSLSVRCDLMFRQYLDTLWFLAVPLEIFVEHLQRYCHRSWRRRCFLKHSNREWSCRAAVVLRGRCLFFDRPCGYVYGFLSFVDIFNECLVTESGAASPSTSLNQRAVVFKGGLPKTTCCPKRDSLTGTVAAMRSPQLPRSCSRMNEGGPGSAPRSRFVCTSVQANLSSHPAFLRALCPRGSSVPALPV